MQLGHKYTAITRQATPAAPGHLPAHRQSVRLNRHMDGKVNALITYSCCTASVVPCTLVLIPPNTYLQAKGGRRASRDVSHFGAQERAQAWLCPASFSCHYTMGWRGAGQDCHVTHSQLP